MKPKEKAEALVDNFRSNILSFLSDNMKDQNAKRCALIAVEFAKENPLNTDGYNKYLDELKQEIETL
jgi:putative heme iron utilization protein